MKVGLYFGTYNPIHLGHLIIANHLVEFSDLDQVWMIVTPHNPLKIKDTLLDDQIRLEMVFLATEDYSRIKPCDIEFRLSQPNYTIDTLIHLHEKYPNHEFSLIMGEDNLVNFHKWKNYETILIHHDIYVYPRICNVFMSPILENNTKIHKINAPIIEIASTFIRNSIKKGKNIKPLLSPKVWEYIDHNLLYKK